MSHRILSLSLSLLTILLFFACSEAISKAYADQAASLYERLGGEPNLTIIVDEVIDRTAHDPRTQRSFKGVKLPALKESIVKQFCVISGGPCEYEGETMKNAHEDAQITEAEFDSMVDILREVLDKHVATREKNELLRLLAPMKKDIVAHP